ncbi:MAG: hypothetical protein JO199_04810, partial [Candidatus Eremiobacteraeota bacterium]|nr:hypothetical protein [Candidatus Eremiobacteraeota bacterium]
SCTAAAKLRRDALARSKGNAAYVLWGELLFYCAGIGFVYFGLLHAYAGPMASATIGWQTSPFEYELGWLEIPLGLVACIALWRGYEFRLAATIPFVIFGFAAAAQHIQEIACCKNYAPGNAGPIVWFGDMLLPIFLVLAAVFARRPASR